MIRRQEKSNMYRIWFFIILAFICIMPLQTGTIKTKSQNYEGKYKEYTYYIDHDNGIIIDGYNGENKSTSIPSEIERKKVKGVEEFVFSKCESLEEITIPDGVLELPKITDCISLKRINISETHPTLVSVDGTIFSKDKTTLYRYFGGNGETSYVIPQGVKNIDMEAFLYCKELVDITFPESVTSLNGNSEVGCFVGSDSLKRFVVDKDNKNFTAVDGVLYKKDGDKLEQLVYYPPKKLDISYRVPEGVVGMYTYAFYKCDNLKKLYIPKSMKKIYNHFLECTDLDIMLPDTVRRVGYEGHLTDFPVFEKCKNCCFYVKQYSVTEMFFRSFEAKDVGLKYKVRKVKTYMYGKYRYTVKNNQITIIRYTGRSKNLVIPPRIKGKKVVAIGTNAFGKNEYLKKVTIPLNVTDIGELAFSRCKNLNTVNIPKKVKTIGYGCFSHCSKLKTIKFSKKIEKIDAEAFYLCGSLEEVKLPDSLVYIGDRAFSECSKLKTIKFSKKIEKIDAQAFYFCESLEEVRLPDSLVYIGNGAFGSCRKLKTVVLSKNLKEIGIWAFNGCNNVCVFNVEADTFAYDYVKKFEYKYKVK